MPNLMLRMKLGRGTLEPRLNRVKKFSDAMDSGFESMLGSSQCMDDNPEVKPRMDEYIIERHLGN